MERHQYGWRNSEIRDIHRCDQVHERSLDRQVVVMPAGLRDYEIEADGRESEDRVQQHVSSAAHDE